MIQPGYKPDGWLGFNMVTCVYVKYHDKNTESESFKQLVSKIETVNKKRGKIKQKTGKKYIENRA